MKGTSESDLAAYLQQRDIANSRMLDGRIFRGIVRYVSSPPLRVKVQRTEDSVIDLTDYACSVPGYYPSVGDVVDLIWRSRLEAIVFQPVTFSKTSNYTSPDISGAGLATAAGTPGVHSGYGSLVSITPSVTGRIKVRWSWSVSNNNVNGSCWTRARYGTGAAPTSGSAPVGTGAGPTRLQGGFNANFTQSGMLEVVITGFVIGTAYWLDLIGYVDGGTGSWSNPGVVAEEF